MTGKRVMVVDDQKLVRRSTARVLRAAGAEVTEAGSGEQALFLLSALGEHDILLTDLEMPEMDGEQLLKEVRRLYPKTDRYCYSGNIYKLEEICSGHELALGGWSKDAEPRTLVELLGLGGR